MRADVATASPVLTWPAYFHCFRSIRKSPRTRPNPESLRSAGEQGEGPAPPVLRGSQEGCSLG